MQPRIPFDFFAARALCWLKFNLVSTKVLFCQAAFQPSGSQHIPVPGVVPPQVHDFALLLVELHDVPVGPFLQPVKVWMAV